MIEHDYKLEKYKGRSSRYECPQCHKRYEFTRYILNNSGEYLAPHVGKCNRIVDCGYHCTPKQFFEANKYLMESSNQSKKPMSVFNPKPNPVSFIPFEVLNETLQGWEENTFIQNLLHRIPFPMESKDIETIISLYCLGTICMGYIAGGITFPFIDNKSNIRAIQVKQFDKTNHTEKVDFIHSIFERDCKDKNKPLPEWLKLYLQNDLKVSCLFGEHLLSKYRNNPVALVEAPKTAIIGTLYFGSPEQPANLLWLAVYNLSSLNFDKCKALQGRDVYLFPDLSKPDAKVNCFRLWNDKANEISNHLPGTRFKVSDYLEKNAPEADKKMGLDLADYLIRYDYRGFQQQENPTAQKSELSESIQGEQATPLKQGGEQPQEKEIIEAGAFDISELSECLYKEDKQPDSENLKQIIAELERYFKTVALPAGPVKLKPGNTIINVPLFIDSHLVVVKTNDGKRFAIPYLERLQELKKYLTNNLN